MVYSTKANRYAGKLGAQLLGLNMRELGSFSAAKADAIGHGVM